MSATLYSTPAAGRTRQTIYGDYTANAVSERGGGPWHIQGPLAYYSLCGKKLSTNISLMVLHVSMLECSSCMKLGQKFAEDSRGRG